MPSNIVKTPKDEKLWDKAKASAEKQGGSANYALINHIYQRMKVASSKVS